MSDKLYRFQKVSDSCDCHSHEEEEIRLVTLNGTDRYILRSRYVLREEDCEIDQDPRWQVESWIDTETPLDSLPPMDTLQAPFQSFLNNLVKDLLSEGRTEPKHICPCEDVKPFWIALLGVLQVWRHPKKWCGYSRRMGEPSPLSIEATKSQ